MSVYSEDEAYTTEVENSCGHEVHYTFSLPNFLSVKTWRFERGHQTACNTFPVSGDLQIVFQKVSASEPVLCTVTFKRYDKLAWPVHAYIWMVFCDNNHQHVTCPKLFQKTFMIPGQEIRDTISVMPPDDMRRLPNQLLVVQVSVLIMFCHNEILSDPSGRYYSDSELVHRGKV